MTNADEQPDPLTTINFWLHRCRRYGRRANGVTIDVLALAVDEIVQLCGRLEACQDRHNQLEAIARGRPLRISGGAR
jgi:hypothetical protein